MIFGAVSHCALPLEFEIPLVDSPTVMHHCHETSPIIARIGSIFLLITNSSYMNTSANLSTLKNALLTLQF